MADYRPFFKLTTTFPENPKVLEAGPDGAWLYICALAYCARHTTDGLFPVDVVPKLSNLRFPRKAASKLLSVSLWHAEGHDCPKCPPVPSGRFMIHDYLEHQSSSVDVASMRSQRAVAGRTGGRKRAENAGQVLKAVDEGSSKSLGFAYDTVQAEVEVEIEEENTSPPPPQRGEARPPQADDPPQDALPGMPAPAEAAKKPRAAPKPKTRIPDDFAMTPDMEGWLRDMCPHLNGRLETEYFINYWRDEGGVRAQKTDWGLTWRKWMIRQEKRAPGQATPQYGGYNNGYKPSTTDQRVAQALELKKYFPRKGG